MSSNSTKQHWEKIYQAKDTVHDVSWYQDTPKTSIDLNLFNNRTKKMQRPGNYAIFQKFNKTGIRARI